MYRYYNVQDLTAWQALLLGEQKKYINFLLHRRIR